MTKKTVGKTYPWNLLNAAFGNDFSTTCADKATVVKGLEFLLYTDMSYRNAEILRLRYRDNQTPRYLAKQYNIATEHLKKIIETELLKMKYPYRAAYLLHGRTDGVEEAVLRKETENAATKAKRERDARLAREAKEREECFFHRRAGMYQESILNIADPFRRVEAIIERGGAEPLRKTRLSQEVLSVLAKAEEPVKSVIQLCFLNYRDILYMRNADPEHLRMIEAELKRLDLALDNGLLSNPSKKYDYMCHAVAVIKLPANDEIDDSSPQASP